MEVIIVEIHVYPVIVGIKYYLNWLKYVIWGL